MPIHHAVLALLERGEAHGYELKTQFVEAVGPQWGDLNIGHLYQVLDRLVRDGYVTRHAVAQERRPDKLVYRLTDDGSAELKRWLKTPSVRQGGYRDDFFLKIAAAANLGLGALRRVVSVQRKAYLEELAALTELRAAHAGEPLVALLVDAALLHTEANLRVVDLAERESETLARAGRRRGSGSAALRRAASG
jgi:DNA-binding PadR family transcriptional regulator